MPRFTPFDFGVTRVMSLFHQDWKHEGDTPADAVANDLARSEDEHVLAVRRDARALDSLSSPALEVLWEAGCQYMPAFEDLGGGTTWTRTVAGLCDARLSANATGHVLTGADAEDGTACLDAVVAEIGEARFLTAEVRSALTDCARHCTPDLAFRILLRAMRCAPEVSLSAAQYTRLEAIGAAMRYGEFLVDSVRYQVQEP
ncbi:hypothetical protein OG266_13490 [Streptomyces sp. NBC_00554]|uniref:hypothetical protein n=1 Tax=unclassified Streptomyces TaxID=2593676 RepID=UPI00225889D4|nr:hypothetical protein [Streptomyces sp. NBC_00620]MCX4971338.1 hypothetical protein [Streptomyces sp. NBC_00620]WUC49373.1 hypothetical protein OG266_13490 [Streptomyces sp. NBC_00554]